MGMGSSFLKILGYGKRRRIMLELKNSGLPLYIDEKNHVMALSALLKYDGFGRKTVEKMQGLLADDMICPWMSWFTMYTVVLLIQRTKNY